MPRTAYVEVPDLPLQVLLRRRPEWAGLPAAVVDRDRPQGRVLWANGPARGRGVVPGLRYASALALAPDLRAGEVPPADLEGARAGLLRTLQGLTPGVEPHPGRPGGFWLDPRGLGRLAGPPERWARAVARRVGAEGFRCRVVAGFTRLGTFAAAQRPGPAGVVVFRSPAEEEAVARRVPLGRLGLPPGERERLARLGVRTLGGLLGLPAADLARRIGPGAARLRAWAAAGPEGFAPEPLPSPLVRRAPFDQPEGNLHRLLFRAKGLLDELLAELAERGEALAGLTVRLGLEDGAVREERLRPARPTLDARQVLNLVHLRLEAGGLGGGVEDLELEAEPVPATREQLRLFAERPRRDPRAAARALARLRAELGEDAVVRARLLDGHLPEARFAWEPLGELPPARPRPEAEPVLVRRIFSRPRPLRPLGRHDPDGWMLRGEAAGRVEALHGPYEVSGGWWRTPIHREYHFAELSTGEVLWIYYDRIRRRWFWQGEVE